jgi:hypothetical protein
MAHCSIVTVVASSSVGSFCNFFINRPNIFKNLLFKMFASKIGFGH